MENKEKNSVSELMETTMTKIREMVDSNSVIGEPITTPDGVTLIPVSRVSLGFGSGGGTATVDRVLEMAPQLIDRVEGFVNKKKEEKEFV